MVPSLAQFVVILFVVGALAGCGGNSGGDSSNDQTLKVMSKHDEMSVVAREATATVVAGNPGKWQGVYIHFPCKISNVIQMDNGPAANAMCGAGVTTDVGAAMKQPNIDYSDPNAVANAEAQMQKSMKDSMTKAEDQAMLLLVGDKVSGLDGGQIITVTGPVMGTTEGKNALGATLNYPTVRVDYAE